LFLQFGILGRPWKELFMFLENGWQTARKIGGMHALLKVPAPSNGVWGCSFTVLGCTQ
jgi:hypothetical protein